VEYIDVPALLLLESQGMNYQFKQLNAELFNANINIKFKYKDRKYAVTYLL